MHRPLVHRTTNARIPRAVAAIDPAATPKLRAMSRHVAGTPDEYIIDSGGEDRILGWRVHVEGNDGTHCVKVEIGESMACSPNLGPESQRAIVTAGRSALRPYLNAEKLPRLITVYETELVPSYD
jgi:hypothetical protein